VTSPSPPDGRATHVLLVDDEPGIRRGLRRFLEIRGFRVSEATTCAEAEAAVRRMPPDAIILDHRLPDGDGVALVPRLKELAPETPLIILTAHGSIELAVRAMKDGADQFLTKPVETETLLVVLERALENQRNRQKQSAGSSRRRRQKLDPFLGESSVIHRLEEQARKLLPSESPILLEGETGSGKGILARWLHDHGPRSEEAFVDLNCAALSRELLETELFGHEKGAFTSASGAKEGLLEVAHRGSVFLDEVGDMELGVQPKLLTVLEEKRFRRLGSVRDRHVDIRLIVATHQDLGLLVEEGRFREDLYFRMSTLPLRIPPLRERSADIPLLARHLLGGLLAEVGRPGLSLADDAMAALQRHQWPGNIRELRNVLERGVLASDGEVIRETDLSFGLPPRRPQRAGRESLTELERQGIERALAAEGGHVARAAQRLGIPRSSLYKKLKRYGIRTSR